MSHLDARFQTNNVTIWRLSGRSSRGAPSYDVIGVFGATWRSGGKATRDANGVQFVPKDTYYIDQSSTVKRGDLIARGDRQGESPSGDVVRTVDRDDNSFFNWSDTLTVKTE